MKDGGKDNNGMKTMLNLMFSYEKLAGNLKKVYIYNVKNLKKVQKG